MSDTNASGEDQAVIEALAVWECNRRAKHFKDNGGASSWFDECLPDTQESFRAWAKNVLSLIERVRGLR